MSYTNLLYRPIYRVQGRPAILTVGGVDYPNDGSTLKMLDKTSGISLPGSIELETIRPAAVALVADLLHLGLTLDSLDGANLQLNNRTWYISSHKAQSSPEGEDDGEVYLYLEGALG